MTNYTPVEGKSGLFRDSESTAIINRDKKAYLAYMQRKKDAENKNDELNLNNEDSDYKDLITRLREIKSNIALLEKIIFK